MAARMRNGLDISLDTRATAGIVSGYDEYDGFCGLIIIMEMLGDLNSQ